jgi:hypothetical protein
MLSVVMLNDVVMLSTERQEKVTPKSKLQPNSQNYRKKFVTSFLNGTLISVKRTLTVRYNVVTNLQS